MVTLLIEPFGGLAGDMFLAALLDLGRDAFHEGELRALAEALVPDEFELTVGETERASIRAKRVDVRTPESADPPHRHLSDLVERLAAAHLSPRVQQRAVGALTRLAEAEARAHGIPIEAVHFHEVGAVDTLIDVAGAMRALECLGVDRVVATVPYVGGGTVRCAHGEMPVPTPGTAAVLEGIATTMGPGGERVTPTGAAILAEITDEFLAAGESPPMVRVATGYGAGSRDPAEGPPNLVRVSLVEDAPAARTEAWLLECNLDDATGEEVGFLVRALRVAGALEVWSAPVQMKKDRPAAVVSALCRADARTALETVCFTHSPTLGVRWTRTERTECEREERTVELDVGGKPFAIRVKRRVVRGASGTTELDLSPEFDDLARAAEASGRPLRALEHEAIRAALRGLGE